MSSDPNPKIENKEAAIAEAQVSESETQSGTAAPETSLKTDSTKKDVFADDDDPEWLEPPPAPLDRARGKSTPSTSGPRGGTSPRPPPGGPRKAAGEDREMS